MARSSGSYSSYDFDPPLSCHHMVCSVFSIHWSWSQPCLHVFSRQNAQFFGSWRCSWDATEMIDASNVRCCWRRVNSLAWCRCFHRSWLLAVDCKCGSYRCSPGFSGSQSHCWLRIRIINCLGSQLKVGARGSLKGLLKTNCGHDGGSLGTD